MKTPVRAALRSESTLLPLVADGLGAVDKAHAAIAELKTTSDAAEATLTHRLTEVRKLSEEVAMMQEAGESLARRLESAATAPRRAAAPAPEPRAQKLSGLAAQIAALEAARQRSVPRAVR